MSEDVTGQVAAFVANLRYEHLTPAAVTAAKDVMLDALGVALAGSREEDAEIVTELARQDGGNPESVVIGHHFQAPSSSAAFVNGVAVHALDPGLRLELRHCRPADGRVNASRSGYSRAP
jgi:2-methylcitrate dehydratase PrpD